MNLWIVVLNWNGREDTLACLQSLSRVDAPEGTRLLVVDNGSSDGSEDAIRAQWPDVDFLQTGSNLGFAGGNNAGIERALAGGAGAVLLLNNDTEVAPGFLRPMLAELQSSERTGIVGAQIAYHHDPDRLWAFGGGRFDVATGWVRHIPVPVEPGDLQDRKSRRFYVTGCTMLLRRELIEEVGVLSTDYFHFCEDVDLCLRARAAGWQLAVARDAHVLHKVSATTRVSSPAFLYYNLRSRLNLVRNFGPASAPSWRAVAVLWMRLWRPALLSGQGRGGWRALRLAWRDFQRRETGPAPAELRPAESAT
ncbi:glycosyltransferase family 2 protein [bacterium]|nr:MAG: glycosyltransferase family 2 protein [bacterium]